MSTFEKMEQQLTGTIVTCDLTVDCGASDVSCASHFAPRAQVLHPLGRVNNPQRPEEQTTASA